MFFKMILGALALSLLAGGVAAQQTESADLERCLTQDNDRLRLQCFDAAAGYQPPDAPLPPSRSWTFVEDIDLMTDANTSYALLAATRANNGRESPGSIIIRCLREGGSEVFISTDGYIGDRRNRVPVTYRWNEAAPISECWNSSTTGPAAFLPSGYRDFLAGLQEGGTLVFEWENYRGSRFASVWEDVQLDDNAQFVLGDCQ